MAAPDLEFRILGPLAVRVSSTPVAIGGPKQRALLALLLLSANRVVSRERLVEELFPEQSVNSADHALRNHVSRLRKVLAPATPDEPRLVARAPGYLLRVEPGELDFERFERLVLEGRELLGAGNAQAAVEVFGAAEALWEGRPLADLELEPFARVEVERLEELRLAAVEERIEAELAVGRHPPLVAELEALVAEHPYRERFRAQLMLALYRSGRQAEGLDVYRRTRALLREQLGLEPGVELQQLERAILTQDPSLQPVARDERVAAPVSDACPYKGLAPFETEDADIFFGRERLVDELAARLRETPMLVVVGASGSGKSSLVCAGLIPALGCEHAVIRPGAAPVAALAEALGRRRPDARFVLVVDQFEEVFAPGVAEVDRRAFAAAVADAAWDADRQTLVVLTVRADFFGDLAPYVELADLVAPNHVLLAPMSAGEVRRAITGPAGPAGLEVEPGLVDVLVDEVSGEPGGLPLLSTALEELWHERDGSTLTLDAYERTGGVRAAVGRRAESAFRTLDDTDREIARRIFLRLAAGDGSPTRRRASLAELDADSDPHVARVLAALVARRLLVVDADTVEIVHEALLERWPRLRGWLEEDAQGRRDHERLAQAAAAWDASGRDAGELYRGARLAAATEWADEGGPPLNALEREFLHESRQASVRATRRLRALLAVALALLVAALLAGALALAARSSADRQATAAIAERLGAQALVEPRLDRSLLLARAGTALDGSSATQSNLLAALLRSPAALAVVGVDGRMLDMALSPDGKTLAARGYDGRVAFYDTRTFRRVGKPFVGVGQIRYFGNFQPERALAFSPDGRTLAVGDSDGHNAIVDLAAVRTHVSRGRTTSRSDAVTGDIVYGRDGRTFVTGEDVSGRDRHAREVLVLRRASDGDEIRESKPILGGRLAGLTPDGRSLLVTTDVGRAYLVDARTFARRRTFRVGGAAAISPVGEVAAFGHSDGSVRLLSLRTGGVRAFTPSAGSAVVALAFSRDGRTLASASSSGVVDVWNVPGATLRETFHGQAGLALSPVFSPDGTRLYTASDDGTVVAWDIRGDRRLGRPFRFAPTPRRGQGVQPMLDDAANAVAVERSGQFFVTSPRPGRVTIWRARDQEVVGELKAPTGPISGLAFSRDGRFLAAGGDTPVVWDFRTRRVVRVFPSGGRNRDAAVALSPTGRLLGLAGQDGVLRLYSVATGRSAGTYAVRGTLQDIDFSADGRYVATTGLAGKIWVYDLAQRKLAQLIVEGDAMGAVHFAPDSRTLASGDESGVVDVWDVKTGGRVGPALRGQNAWTFNVAWAPGGDELLTVSGDGNLRLWDVRTGKLVGSPLPSPPGSSAAGALFPDGSHAVAVASSGEGVVWDVRPSSWNAQACRIANRELTRAEWHDAVPERAYRPVCG